VCHLAWPAELETVIDMVTVNAARAMRLADYGLAPGDRADLVVCGSSDVRSTLAELAPRRAVIANGRLAVSSRLEVTRHPRA
jgi:cytosine deaminase